MILRQALAGLGVPYPHRLIPTPRTDAVRPVSPVSAPTHGQHIIKMPFQHRQALAGLGVPYSHRSIPTPRADAVRPVSAPTRSSPYEYALSSPPSTFRTRRPIPAPPC